MDYYSLEVKKGSVAVVQKRWACTCMWRGQGQWAAVVEKTRRLQIEDRPKVSYRSLPIHMSQPLLLH